ncbi:hypothetical protein [Micrococcus sp.]|uniref:hypothetical protein n=1 Tax=Micrococcus sp. TaxID=1271 RepID=UPI0026DC86C2|nr:hypothetical protein [Micrococcus sp.]MDO4240584.1 hypothetical protein [Micrococcus sp.]
MSSTDRPGDPAPATAGGAALRSKLWVAFVVLLTLFFAFFVVRAAVALIGAGGLLPVAIGVSVIVVVALGLALIGREMLFGLQTERLAAILEAEGGLPEDDLPRSPGGRIDRAAADAQFEDFAAEVRAAPQDWRVRYRLSLAYAAAGDRTRARAAAREAIRLHAGR